MAERLSCGLALLTLAAFAVWATAYAVTDRYLWSQFVWWFPWSGYAIVALPGAIVGLLRRDPGWRWLRVFAVAAFAVMVGVGLARDVGWRGAAASKGVSIVHWNASWPDAREASSPAARLLAREADVVVISNPYRFFGDGRDEEWRGRGYQVIVVGAFAIASRVPILEARQLIMKNDCGAARFEIDTRATLGRTLHVLAADLPSGARRSRYQLVQQFASALPDSEERPDVVLGDLNITRGSASLKLLGPELHDAWRDAGRGWGASWPRDVPLLHLDHVLLAPSLRARDYELFDVGAGVHRAQACVVAR